MPSTTSPTLFDTLQDYLEAVQSKYDACISHIEHEYVIDGVRATVRLHHLRFEANGTPKFKALAHAIVDHVIYFCISAKERREPIAAHEYARLFRKARDLFRKYATAGEPGELLLYFLLETVLKAPQVVCKMSLKTNPGDEVKGSDGIHVSWDAPNECLNVFLGEAKLYQNYGDALTNAFASIDSLYANHRDEHELSLVTSHFKHCDVDLQKRISDYLDSTSPVGQCNIVHACLIGFDWSKYKLLDGDKRAEFIAAFADTYREHGKSLAEKTAELFTGFSQRHLTYEFFFLPFPSVQTFRDEFNRALTGVDEE